MIASVKARYENGVLTLLEPLDLWRGLINDFERLRIETDPVDAERRERIIAAGVAYCESSARRGRRRRAHEAGLWPERASGGVAVVT